MRQRSTFLLVSGVTAVVVVLALLRTSAQFPPAVSFVDTGPHGARAPQARGFTPLAGAVSSVVPHPTNPDILWIGAVNGGIWKTTTATHAKPDWVPLTDH